MSDAAQIDASGKVGLLGAGWTITGPNVPPMAVTVFLRVPWEEAGQRRTFRIRLLDEEDQPVYRPEATKIRSNSPVNCSSTRSEHYRMTR
ncbi:hypothetical protein FHX40_4518 [Thermopolyspora flexuosa]|uniref:Uncharacterized protein n=1 Tax=Thermopolyspora flexuosa TaxID=103836 RepID=A0A543J4J0_9ACTN|nr:hypothetical protein FHX40_4518 [Thermopolyspora flexuosa]